MDKSDSLRSFAEAVAHGKELGCVHIFHVMRLGGSTAYVFAAPGENLIRLRTKIIGMEGSRIILERSLLEAS